MIANVLSIQSKQSPKSNSSTYFKGVGKYDKSVEILKMLAAPPMGGKI